MHVIAEENCIIQAEIRTKDPSFIPAKICKILKQVCLSSALKPIRL